jgi:nucleoside-diphosphate-sugar epimerase
VLSWIALEDAAAAVTLAVESSSPGQVYNVVDDQPVAFADYVNEMARQLGAKPPRARPKWLVRPFASYVATVVDEVRLPVSNALLQRDLD